MKKTKKLNEEKTKNFEALAIVFMMWYKQMYRYNIRDFNPKR